MKIPLFKRIQTSTVNGRHTPLPRSAVGGAPYFSFSFIEQVDCSMLARCDTHKRMKHVSPPPHVGRTHFAVPPVLLTESLATPFVHLLCEQTCDIKYKRLHGRRCV